MPLLRNMILKSAAFVLFGLLFSPAYSETSTGIFSADSPVFSGYKEGVEGFNVAIAQLTAYGEKTNLGTFLNGLFQSVDGSFQGFSESSEAAIAKHNELNTKQAEVQAEIDEQRESMRLKGVEKAKKDQELTAKKQTLTQNEAHAASTEATLQQLEATVREAEKKYKKCRKKWYRRLSCHLSGAFKKTKKRRNEARELRGQQQNTLAAARQAVQTTEAEITSLNQAIAGIQTTIEGLNQEITKLNQEQTLVLSLKDKINSVNSHFSKLVGLMGASSDAIKTSQAALLINEIESLIDFDSLISPIIQAGEVLAGQGLRNVPNLKVLTPDDKELLKTKLRFIQAKLIELRERYGDDASVMDAWNQYESEPEDTEEPAGEPEVVVDVPDEPLEVPEQLPEEEEEEDTPSDDQENTKQLPKTTQEPQLSQWPEMPKFPEMPEFPEMPNLPDMSPPMVPQNGDVPLGRTRTQIAQDKAFFCRICLNERCRKEFC